MIPKTDQQLPEKISDALKIVAKNTQIPFAIFCDMTWKVFAEIPPKDPFLTSEDIRMSYAAKTAVLRVLEGWRALRKNGYNGGPVS
jgi:hypothetical protein